MHCILCYNLKIPTVDVSISKSSQKNKKRRAKKKEKESTSADVEKDEIDEEPSPVVEEVNPIELIKQKIEEAKLAKVSFVVARVYNAKLLMVSYAYGVSIKYNYHT